MATSASCTPGAAEMCVGTPMQLIDGNGLRGRCRALDGTEHEIDLLLVGHVPSGSWLLTHLGTAREVIDGGHAIRVGAALAALHELGAGRPANLDLAFADLLDREPQLPDFLKETIDD